MQRLFLVTGVSRIFLALSLLFVMQSAWAANVFYGELKTGLQPISSDRYGASYYVPERFDAARDWPLVVVLYSDEAEKGKIFVEKWLAEIKKREVIGLFVSYLNPRESPFGSDERLSRLIRLLESQYPIDERRVLLTAFGEAAHYAFYFGFSHPNDVSAVGLVGGGAQGRFQPLLRQDHAGAKAVPFLILYGDRDETIRRDRFVSVHEGFDRRGYQIALEEYEGFGHRFYPEFSVRIMEWFGAQAIAESVVKEKTMGTGSQVSSMMFGVPQWASAFVRGIFEG